MAKETPDGQEKTEDPSGRRKSQARQDGKVPRSEDINMVAGLVAAAGYFALGTGAMVDDGLQLMQHFFSHAGEIPLTESGVPGLVRMVCTHLLTMVLPLLLILMVVAVFANVFQFGFLFTLKPFKPDLSRFNTLKGIKRKVSLNNGVRLLKSVLKIAIIGAVPIMVILSEVNTLPLMIDQGVGDIMRRMGWLLLKILFFTTLVLLVLAIIDLIYERWKYTQDLKMTKQEKKDELRQSEGDPKVKARIRREQIAILRRAMMDAVPKADVVITNPTHYAVALKYDRLSMPAPKVVAKGARKTAQKIKALAREHDVPIVENKPLAQALFKMTEVGDIVPEELYTAVAAVLAYVYTRRAA